MLVQAGQGFGLLADGERATLQPLNRASHPLGLNVPGDGTLGKSLLTAARRPFFVEKSWVLVEGSLFFWLGRA